MKPITVTPSKLIVGQDTHEGETGKNNEDTGSFAAFQVSAQNRTEVYLGIVGDGIGGHQAGERASQLGVQTIEDYFRRATTAALTEHFRESFRMANEQIVAEGQASSQMRGMGTTMTVAAIMDGRLYTAHVGDSRAYLIRDGAIHQLTVDHTWAQEAIEAGRLTAAEAKQHPNRNVIKRYMGIQADLEVDFRLANPDDPTQRPTEANQGLLLRPGDTILLCSDGLSDMISDEDILQEVDNHPPQPAARRLTMRARQAGGYDNITVVLMQLPGKKPSAGAGKPVAPAAAAAPAAAPVRKRSMAPVVGAVVVIALLAVLAVFALPAIKEMIGGQPTATVAPAATESATEEPAITDTAVPSPSATSTTEVMAPAVTASATAEEGGEPTETPAETPTSVPTRTPTNTPTPSNTPRPPTVTPTPTATDTPSSSEPPPAAKPTNTTAPPSTPIGG